MNEDAAVQAVYVVIDDAKEALVGGIAHQGEPRQILHLADTLLAAPLMYYAIGIDCLRAREFSMPGVNTLANAIPWAQYEMVIQIADVANIQPGDVVPYSQVHSDFRKLRDRVVRLIRNTTEWFPTATSTPRFRMPRDANGNNDKLVRVENQLTSFSDMQQQDYALLFSRIQFVLIDHCSDSSLLYS